MIVKSGTGARVSLTQHRMTYLSTGEYVRRCSLREFFRNGWRAEYVTTYLAGYEYHYRDAENYPNRTFRFGCCEFSPSHTRIIRKWAKGK